MTVTQILYVCEKCGKTDAHVDRIAGCTVTVRLCPQCMTNWGIYVRALRVWAHYLEADWQERHAVDVRAAVRALTDCQRYREELCCLALRWLGREEAAQEQATAWDRERNETIAALRSLCAAFGDNDWSNDLHLADVVAKHLEPYLTGEAR